MNRVWKLVLVAAAMVTTAACEGPEPAPPPPTAGSAHVDFPLVGGHLIADCDACHVGGAAEQGLSSSLANGWVSQIGTDCLGCHTDTVDQLFGGDHKEGQTCGASGCHSVQDRCWGQVWRECGDPTQPTATPPPLDHEGEVALRFPLEGVHGSSGCADCHGADTSDQAGWGVRCENCHPRIDGPGADHYPPPVAGAPDADRGCMACHATLDASERLTVPSDWNTGSVVHDFIWPHNDAFACADCHTTPGQQTATAFDCTSCHNALSPIHNNVPPGTLCNSCHVDGL